MNLFIDTTVLLSFYELSSDSLDELEKLITVVTKNEATLWLPDQVYREFWKNREGSVMRLIKEFEDHACLAPAPLLIRDDPSFRAIIKNVDEVEQLKRKIVDRVRAQIVEEQTRADRAIRTLFQHAQHIETNDLFPIAFQRALRRLPPGKEEGLGDRLNWVALLHAVPPGADLHVISGDGDYESEASREQARLYLVKEWQKKKSGNLKLWKRLSKYLAAHFPDAENAIDMERSIAAQRLWDSSSFGATHEAVSNLIPFDRFSAEQSPLIAAALIQNSQVRWIRGDADVKAFAQKFVNNNSGHLDPEIRSRIVEVYELSE